MRFVLAAILSFISALALAGPPPLATPDLAPLVFRDGADILPASVARAIGFAPDGGIFIAGAFTSVNGEPRPHGVARLNTDGTLDLGWAPTLPYNTAPRLGAQGPLGTVALVYQFPNAAANATYEALVHVPIGSGAGTVIRSTTTPDRLAFLAIAFGSADALYSAQGGNPYGFGGPPAAVVRFRSDGSVDPAFELTLSGDYSACPPVINPMPFVSAMAVRDGYVYLGGNFKSEGNARATGSVGGVVRVDAATGDLDPAWHPMDPAQAAAAVSKAGEEKFTCVPPPSGTVLAMAFTSDGKVYLAGRFQQRQGRSGLGRFSTSGGGAVDPTWVPPNLPANSLALDEAGGHLYLQRGATTTLEAGADRDGVVAISTAPGAAVIGSWDPGIVFAPTTPSSVLPLMSLAGDRLLVGGEFTAVGTTPRAGLAGIPLGSAPVTWPVITLSRRLLDFGSSLQSLQRARTLTVGNAGSGPLTVGAIELSPSSSLSQINTCTAPLAPGATCTITVTGQLEPVNFLAGTLFVPSDGSGTTQRVWIGGQTISLTGGGFFASTFVGSTRTKAATLTNTSPDPVDVETIRLIQTNNDYSLSHDCPASLAPGASCTATVTFMPHQAGAAEFAALQVIASATAPGLNVSGYAVEPGAMTDQDNDGIPDSVEVELSRNVLVRDNDVFADAVLFAMQQYRDFLGREGDAYGISYWSGQVSGGTMSRGQVVESFFASPEFQGTIAPVVRLYFAYFLRVPDYAGLSFWLGYVRAGNSFDAVSSVFAQSPEFQQRYGALDSGQFVDLVYQNVLGRAPDAQGRAFWKDQLDSASMSRGQVMLQFSESAEYRGQIAAEVYVTMAYAGMLRRAPDAAGFSSWVQSIDAGNSGVALIDGFLASAEYRRRFLP